MIDLLTTSLGAVFRIFLAAGVGAWLARRNVLDSNGRTLLSRVILLSLLPGLLFSKLSQSASPEALRSWVLLPVAALFYIAVGFVVGRVLAGSFLQDPDERRVFTAASAFGNSGYVPIPLAAALAATSTLFRNDAEAASRGIACVSVYLVAMSPCLWGIGYPYLSGRPLRSLSLRRLLSPPVIAALAGIIVGAIPVLRAVLVAPHAPLRIVTDVAELVGAGAIPCSLLVMGANLVDREEESRAARFSVYASSGPAQAGVGLAPILILILTRFVFLPLAGLAFAWTARRLGLLPRDPMFMMVLLIESSVPPATNLVVMCQLHGRGERRMARAQFWTYLAAAPMLTINVSIFLWVVRNWTAAASV